MAERPKPLSEQLIEWKSRSKKPAKKSGWKARSKLEWKERLLKKQFDCARPRASEWGRDRF